jgi:cyclophilin family peptidyl-prolyl cis-trans isomerase
MVRMAAAQRILGDRTSLVRALSLLKSPDNMVKAAVTNWLQDHPNKNAETVLLNLAGTSKDPILVNNAVLALKALYESQPARRRGSQGARVLLPTLLGHEDPGVRNAGLELAKCLGAWPNFFEHSPDPVDVVAIKEIRSAVVTTAQGDIILELYPEHAPLTVANFARLADSGFYDGLPFHRVISDFVAQGGDPRGDGWGGPGHTIPDEINDLRYEAGTVGMALSGRDSGGSQWFMTLAPQPHLDDRYAIFGRVVSGLSVARVLLPGDRIENITIERVMGPVVRADEDREVAEAMLAQLQSNSDWISSESKKKKKKEAKKKDKADKASKKKAKKNKKGKNSDDADVGPEGEEATEDNLPDEHEKAEEDPDLIEGEKVDVIDPNQDE